MPDSDFRIDISTDLRSWMTVASADTYMYAKRQADKFSREPDTYARIVRPDLDDDVILTLRDGTPIYAKLPK